MNGNIFFLFCTHLSYSTNIVPFDRPKPPLQEALYIFEKSMVLGETFMRMTENERAGNCIGN